MTDYEYHQFKNNFMYKELNNSLEIVQQFLKKKKLILVGGQAIDYAMRLKNDKLYSDHTVPDYDFYSPNHYQDAIELGNILCAEDMPNVSVIRALHVTTVRVRVEYETVADITYCPKPIYDKLKTIEYQGIRVIHPEEQMVDQHRALAYPWENPNAPTYTFRWEKDFTRYDLLRKHYGISKVKDNRTAVSVTLPINLLMDNCLGSYLANAVILGDYNITEGEIEFKLIGNEIQIITDDLEGIKIELEKHYNKLKDVKFSSALKLYNSFLDRVGESYQGEITIGKDKIKVIIINNKDHLLGASKIKNVNIGVANPQFLLLYYLHTNDNNSYNEIYDLITKTIDSGKKELNNIQLMPTTDTYGTSNVSASEELSKEIFHDKSKMDQAPKNLYPKPPKCSIEGEFSYDSKYFQIDGQLA